MNLHTSLYISLSEAVCLLKNHVGLKSQGFRVLLGLHPKICYARALAVSSGKGSQIYGVLGHRKEPGWHRSIGYRRRILQYILHKYLNSLFAIEKGGYLVSCHGNNRWIECGKGGRCSHCVGELLRSWTRYRRSAVWRSIHVGDLDGTRTSRSLGACICRNRGMLWRNGWAAECGQADVRRHAAGLQGGWNGRTPAAHQKSLKIYLWVQVNRCKLYIIIILNILWLIKLKIRFELGKTLHFLFNLSFDSYYRLNLNIIRQSDLAMSIYL